MTHGQRKQKARLAAKRTRRGTALWKIARDRASRKAMSGLKRKFNS